MKKTAFEMAKQHFFKYAEILDLDKRYPKQNLAHRLTEPDRSVEARVSLHRDDGSILVCRGYRVQFNDDRGPYKGGLRFHPVVELEEVKARHIVIRHDEKTGKDFRVVLPELRLKKG